MPVLVSFQSEAKNRGSSTLVSEHRFFMSAPFFVSSPTGVLGAEGPRLPPARHCHLPPPRSRRVQFFVCALSPCVILKRSEESRLFLPFRHPQRSEGSRTPERASRPHRDKVTQRLPSVRIFRAFADSAIHAFSQNNFDGAKLRIEGSRPKTTTGGINWPFTRKSSSRNDHANSPFPGT
jgi:hypothetical protein